MPIDRDTALKTAERLLRQGKLDGAIEQYVRLVDDQPRDWNSINTLGDLYVRAGDTDRAVAQYVRIADYLFAEGFFPKAAALYKKALKTRNDHEHTLLRLSDIAARQGLLADAKLYLRQLAQQRQNRGDQKGVAECIIRMGGIDENDGDAKVTAARTAHGMGDTAQAVTLFQEAATAFEKQKREGDALEARIAATELAPSDAKLRADVARALIAAGQSERAQPFLSAEGAGEDVDLLLAIGRADLLAGRGADAHATLMRVVALDRDRQEAIDALANELLAAGRVPDAYACLEILVDAALFEAAFDRAAGILEQFIERHAEIPALLKLVDVYVDAGFDDRITAVQGRLADAYLDLGQCAEARLIAEDLVAREPHDDSHAQRLRRALTALGVADPEEVIARQRESGALFGDELDLESDDLGLDDSRLSSHPAAPPTGEADVHPDTPPDLHAFAAPGAPAPESLPAIATPPLAEEGDDPVELDSPPPRETVEIDLSSVLADLNAPRAGASAGREEQISEAAACFEKAQEDLRRGLVADAAAALQAAARVPQFRFTAAAQLGRLLASRGDTRAAVEWFERAAEAPAPSPDEGFSVLYDLADALDRTGEPVRALAVLIELESDAGVYRDVRTRIEQLSRGAAATSRGLDRERP